MSSIYCYKQGTPLELLTIVDDFISFSFTRSYNGVRNWELVLDANSLNAARIEGVDFISVGPKVAGLVKKVQKDRREEENVIIYNGVELKGLANSRIIMPDTGSANERFTNKSPEYIMYQLLNKQMVETGDLKRKIANVIIEPPMVLTNEVVENKQYRFQNLGESIEQMAVTFGLGWYADIVDGQIVFNIVKGTDRTDEQEINEKLILDYERDNIVRSGYEEHRLITRTALVAGKGEGVERTVVYLGDDKEDIDRIEMYVDARDINEVSDLELRGREKLNGRTEENIYSIKIGAPLISKYKESFDVGDLGTIRDSILGIQTNCRLTEITEIYEDGVFSLDTVFGLNRNSLALLVREGRTAADSLLNNETEYIPAATEITIAGQTLTLQDGLNFTQLSASGITTGTLDAENVNVVNLNASNILFGKMEGDRLKANSITATHIGTNEIIANTANIKNGIITNAHIGVAGIDYAKIKDLSADTAIFRTIVAGGDVYIDRLKVAAANMTSLEVGDLILRNPDGSLHQLYVDGSGNVQTKPYEILYQNLSNEALLKVSEYTVYKSETAPTSPYVGQLWMNLTTGILLRCAAITPSIVWEDVKAGELHTSYIDAVEKGLNILTSGELNILSGGNLNIKSLGSTTLNTIEMNSGGMSVSSTGELNMEGADINMTSGGKINLEGPDGIVFSTGVGLETTVKNQLGQTAIVEFEKGTILDEHNTATAVTLKVYHNGVDVTGLIPKTAVKWYLREAEDSSWTLKAANTKSVTLTSADIDFRSVLRCSIDTVELLVSAWVENGELYIEDNGLGGESALFSLVEGELLYAGSSDYYGYENRLNASLTIGSFVIDTQLSNLATSYISIKREAIDIKSAGVLNIKANGIIDVEANGKINMTTPDALMVTATKTLATYTAEEISEGLTDQKIWKQAAPPASVAGGFQLVAGTLWLNTASTTHAATGITSGSLARYTGTSWIPIVAGEVKTSKISVSGDEINVSSGGNLKLSAPNDLVLTAGTGASAVGVANGKYVNGTTNGGYFLYAGNANPAAAPFSVKMDGTITNVGNAYTQTAVDNASSTNGVKMDVFFPSDVSAVDKCYLSVKFSAFRAYSTGAASGGSSQQTSSEGGGAEKTSRNGGGATITSASNNVDNTGSASGDTGSPSEEYTGTGGSGSTGAGTSHNHTVQNHRHSYTMGASDTGYTQPTCTYDASHTHAGPSHKHSLNGHVHSLGAHTHSLNEHTHKVTVGSHTHIVDIDAHTHTVNVPDHAHGITYGIYEGTTPTRCSVYVDGTLVPALSSVTAFTSHNIADYFSKTGGKITRNTFHTVEIRPNTALGRISAHLYIKTTQISKVAGNL